jgi:hypothetical protein
MVRRAACLNNKVASYNGKTTLSMELLGFMRVRTTWEIDGKRLDTSPIGAFKRQLNKLSADYVQALFATRKLAWSMSLLIVIWGICASASF